MVKWSWNMWIKRILTFLFVCLLAGLFAVQSQKAPPLLQYVFLPPDLSVDHAAFGEDNGENEDTERNEPLKPLDVFLKGWDSFLEEQQNSLTAAILCAHYPFVTMQTEQGGSASGELLAVTGQLHTLPQGILLSGRHLYQEEVEMGTSSAVLDEGLAIALFRQGDPVGMTFTLNDQCFTVVGVVRHARTVGDRAEYGLMVPLKAFDKQPQWEVMTVQLMPQGGSGTRKGLENALGSWQQGGQAIDLVKEKYRTLLPLRVLICLIVFSLALIWLRYARRLSVSLVANDRQRLEKHYALELMPRFILSGVLIVLMHLVGVGVMILAFIQLLEPVYVFPEWVPAILVEPREIAATFWHNRSLVNGLVSLRSKELLYLGALRSYLIALAVVIAGLLITPMGKLYRLSGAKEKG